MSTPTEEPVTVPKNTTPTWEVELLLSGALVFATMQAPAAIDELFFEWTPRAAGSAIVASSILYLYAKVVAYALICTFSLHLALRAIWVAMLGLYSVYPGGIDYEKMKRSPVFLSHIRQTIPSPLEAIERTDNYASFVFAFGMLIVIMSITVTLMTSGLVLGVELLFHWLTGESAPPWAMFTIVACLIVPIVLAGLLDRRWGGRLAPDGRIATAILWVYRGNSFVSSGWISGYLLQTILSRFGTLRGNAVLLGAIYTLIALVFVEILVLTGRMQLPGESLLPDDARDRQLLSGYYRSRAGELAPLRPLPTIAAPVVSEPYLDLFIPHIESTNRDDFARVCPGLKRPDTSQDPVQALAQETAHTSAFLDCAARIYRLTLNGTPLDVLFDVSADRHGLPGYQAMIDVRDLQPGRHVLAIERPQDPKEPPREPWRIVFWR